MALDYVLSRPGRHLANEAERLDYFHRERGIGMVCFPVKTYSAQGKAASTRLCFVDKFAISVSDQALVSFSYVDEEEIAKPALETYLAPYARPFVAHERFQLVFVATKEQLFLKAQRTIRRLFHYPDPGGREDISHLLTWLRLENLARRERYGDLGPGDFEDRWTLRNEFLGAGYEAFMDGWKQRIKQAVLDNLHGKCRFPLRSAMELVPCYLLHNYAFLHTAKPRMRGQDP
jgi:hypothetical protein